MNTNTKLKHKLKTLNKVRGIKIKYKKVRKHENFRKKQKKSNVTIKIKTHYTKRTEFVVINQKSWILDHTSQNSTNTRR